MVIPGSASILNTYPPDRLHVSTAPAALDSAKTNTASRLETVISRTRLHIAIPFTLLSTPEPSRLMVSAHDLEFAGALALRLLSPESLHKGKEVSNSHRFGKHEGGPCLLGLLDAIG